ncbi:AAA family ATPase [Pyrococcus kukulkanii]|uniref:UvrD-helicase domain-containing protein n=1 Tax=Pyrococcus kukulkanii TaxID=1609559 RepID=UPI00356AF122
MSELKSARVKVIGPPGTGKTRSLVDLVERVQGGDRGVLETLGLERAPLGEELAFISLENSAIREILDRRGQNEKAGWIRTLDGVIVRALVVSGKIESKEIPSPQKIDVIKQRLMKRFRLDADTLNTHLAELTRAIHTFQDIEQVLKHNKVVRAYYAELAKRKMLDYDLARLRALEYADEIREAIENDEKHDLPRLVVVDEGQDFSALDWKVLSSLFPSAQLVVAGDDMQSIFEFRGAKSEIFKNMSAKKVVLLDKSYRLPKDVIDVAKSFADATLKYHYEFAAAEDKEAKFFEVDSVKKLLALVRAALKRCFTVAVLTRRISTAELLRNVFIRNHIFADTFQQNYASKVHEVRQLLELVQKQHKSKRDYEQLVKLTQKLVEDQRVVRYVTETFKQGQIFWHRLNSLEIKLRMLKTHIRELVEAYNTSGEGVVVDTMHSAKGREADYVVLVDDFHSKTPSWTEEARLLYVALTRAKRGVVFAKIFKKNKLVELAEEIANEVASVRAL